MIPELLAMIGRDDDERILVEAALLESVEDRREVHVMIADLAVVEGLEVRPIARVQLDLPHLYVLEEERVCAEVHLTAVVPIAVEPKILFGRAIGDMRVDGVDIKEEGLLALP